MAEGFTKVPSIYPKLLEIRQSKTAEFKGNRYLKETTKLRYYQVIGALHMMLLNRMVLGDATGTGKTLEAIAAYSWLLEQNPNLKCFIAAPKSALGQWQEEFDKFSQGISCRVITNEQGFLTGSKARLAQYRQFKENVMIANYFTVRADYEFIKQALGSQYMVVMDECTSFKNRKSETFFACNELARPASRVYGLSATIIKNNLEEVFAIYQVIVPGLFGTITSFINTFCNQRLMKFMINGKYRHIPKTTGYKNLHQFKQLIDPYLLARKKEDVASELPSLISKKVMLEMESDQAEVYKKALDGIVYEERVKREFFEISDKIRNGDKDEKTLAKYAERKEKYEKFATEEGKKRGKLAALTFCQMVSNSPALVGEHGGSSKEEELRRLLTEELLTEKIIIFTRFKSGIPYLETICENLHIQYTKITGDVLTTQERDQARHRFQDDPACRIIFITTAGAASINLQAAGVIIFIDTPWSYGDLVQTIGRAQRIGSLQEHILLIHLINKKTIDSRVISRVTGKKNLSDEILGDTAKGALDFTEHEDTINGLFEDLLEDAKEGSI